MYYSSQHSRTTSIRHAGCDSQLEQYITVAQLFPLRTLVKRHGVRSQETSAGVDEKEESTAELEFSCVIYDSDGAAYVGEEEDMTVDEGAIAWDMAFDPAVGDFQDCIRTSTPKPTSRDVSVTPSVCGPIMYTYKV